MTLGKNWLGAALFAGFVTVGVTASAQQSGLVNVNLSNITIDLADVLDVDVSQIPVTVQAPIGIAANVCNIAANVLAADVRDDGNADCDATSNSTALTHIVQRQLVLQ
jgi:hypothetical protein